MNSTTNNSFLMKERGRGTRSKVSIGLPVYNGAKTINEAVDCLLAQTFQNFELIISDNASTDRTLWMCEQYATRDPRVRIVRQPGNLGAFRNFRAVLESGVGDYFMWAAADDLWAPEFIETCVRMLDANRELGLAMTGWEIRGRWTGPFFRAKDFPNWTPLSDVDITRRLAYFLELHTLSHKANFLYGLWRRELAIQVYDFFDGTAEYLVYHGLDIAMLAYALGLRPFGFIPDRFFYKMYNRFAVPSAPWNLVRLMTALYNPLKPLYRRLRKQKRTLSEENLALTRISLQGLGYDAVAIARLLMYAGTKRI